MEKSRCPIAETPLEVSHWARREPITPIKADLAQVLSYMKAEPLPSAFTLYIHSFWCPELHCGSLFNRSNRWQEWAAYLERIIISSKKKFKNGPEISPNGFLST